MADTAQPPERGDEEVLRKRLMNRIALAGVAVVALLGGLAIVDSLYISPSPPALSKRSLPESVKQMEPVQPIAIAPSDASPSSAELPEPPKPQAIPMLPPPTREESAPPTVDVPSQRKAPREVVEPNIAPSLPAHGFMLQMGVFNSTEHAQELLSKLKQAGIPAQIESRVQVGPFKTKAEADATRAKLKSLGMDAGLLLPLRK